MDGENNEKPYEQMGWFGGKHYFWKHPYRRWETLLKVDISQLEIVRFNESVNDGLVGL